MRNNKVVFKVLLVVFIILFFIGFQTVNMIYRNVPTDQQNKTIIFLALALLLFTVVGAIFCVNKLCELPKLIKLGMQFFSVLAIIVICASLVYAVWSLVV